MKAYFNSYFNYTSSSLIERALSVLTSQQKKIIFIVSAVFSFLAVYCLANRYCFNKKKINKVKTEQENSLKTLFPVTQSESALGTPKEGLNIEEKCSNTECKDYNKMVIIPKGFGDFNMNQECCETTCPCCETPLDPDNVNTIIIHSCLFEIHAMNTSEQRIKESFKLSPQQSLRLGIDQAYYMEINTKNL